VLGVGLEGEPAPGDDQVADPVLSRAPAPITQPGEQAEALGRTEVSERPVIRLLAGSEVPLAEVDGHAHPVRRAFQLVRQGRAHGKQVPATGNRGRNVLRVDRERRVPDDEPANLRAKALEQVVGRDSLRRQRDDVAQPRLGRGIGGTVAAVPQAYEVDAGRTTGVLPQRRPVDEPLERGEEELLVVRDSADVRDEQARLRVRGRRRQQRHAGDEDSEHGQDELASSPLESVHTPALAGECTPRARTPGR
jgi:hypothetical protein